MKLKIIQEKDNPVLQRKELKIEVDFEGGPTPKLAELTAEVAKTKGADAALVEVSKLFSATGQARGIAFVKIWGSAEAREKAKPRKRAEKAKKEVKPVEEKPKEAPKEEKKEEKAAEEKKGE